MFAKYAEVAKRWSTVQSYQDYRKFKFAKPTRATNPEEMEAIAIREKSGLCPRCDSSFAPISAEYRVENRIFLQRKCHDCGFKYTFREFAPVPDVTAEEALRAKAKECEDELNRLFAFVEAKVPQWLPLVPLLDKKLDPRTDEEKARSARELQAKLLQRALEPPPPKPRLGFDDETQTVVLDGVSRPCPNPRCYFLYKAIADRKGKEVNSTALRSEVKGTGGDKTIRKLLDTLPRALRSTVKSGPLGYWLNLPPEPPEKKIRT
jgi:RNase P subunit RPR2